MFDPIELLKTNTACSAKVTDGDPFKAEQPFGRILGNSAAAGATLSPAASVLFTLGEQLARQDGADGKAKKTKKLKKNKIAEDLIKALNFNLLIALRLVIEEFRAMGRVTTVRAVEYIDATGMGGISAVNFTDVNGVRYSFSRKDGKVRRSGGRKRLKGLIEVVKPDGTVVYIIGQ